VTSSANSSESQSVPKDERLGTDDGKNLKDRRKPAVKQDKEPAIIVRKPDATMEPAPQNNQLMPKYRVLSLQSHLRLEWRGQDGEDETQEPDHSASLGDSVTSSTRIKFSVHTGGAAINLRAAAATR
jgi:hypothetical protein